MIKGNEVVNGLCKEGVPLFCEYKVIGDTDRDGLRENDRIYQEGVQRPQASNVKVKIDAPVMVKNKVTNRVGSLDYIFVVVKGVKEPRIMFRNEFARAGVRPQHVLAGGRMRDSAWGGDGDVLVRHHVATDFGDVFPL